MQLRDYQNEAINSIFNYFLTKSGNPVVVMPTGTGKSVVIGGFIRDVFKRYPNQRIMMLTHVKELIAQNAEKLQQMWPHAPVGIYSAGLRQKEKNLPIIFGGVASVAKSAKDFGHVDLLIVDECHMISPSDETMYQKVLSDLMQINPYLKVIGLSATPYRMKQGMITDDGIFTDICIDLSAPECFVRFIKEGYLSPLITFPTETEIDISSVSVIGGDYNKRELESVSNVDAINYNVCREIISKGHNRKRWLIFTNGISHAENICAVLQSFGIDAETVHSKKGADDNDKIIEKFKKGNLRCLVNSNKLTTGFDCPDIDLIGMVRHTRSTSLYVQMLGRGTRVAPGKDNCLVLDFARNIERLGPINDPVKPLPPGAKRSAGEVPVKICESCSAYNWGAARFCVNCGKEFTFKTKLVQFASDAQIIKGLEVEPRLEWLDVSTVYYNLHSKPNHKPTIKVTYVCGLSNFNEWVCLEHDGMPGKKARDWWRRRHESEPPVTTFLALEVIRESRMPKKIKVHTNKKPYPEIIDYEF